MESEFESELKGRLVFFRESRLDYRVVRKTKKKELEKAFSTECVHSF